MTGTLESYSRDGATRLATGSLAALDNQVDPATSTLRLKALVANPGRTLWPNAFVKVRMRVATRAGAVVIPLVAVQDGPSGSFVYRVGADHIARVQAVTVALTTGDVAVIGQGVAPGDPVVVEGQEHVRPGGPVAISPGASAP